MVNHVWRLYTKESLWRITVSQNWLYSMQLSFSISLHVSEERRKREEHTEKSERVVTLGRHGGNCASPEQRVSVKRLLCLHNTCLSMETNWPPNLDLCPSLVMGTDIHNTQKSKAFLFLSYRLVMPGKIKPYFPPLKILIIIFLKQLSLTLSPT